MAGNQAARRQKLFLPILFLQLTILFYTAAGITGKFASGMPLFSLRFLLLFGLEIVFLGIYAILWQQMIKHIDLSIAYANRSVNLLWTMLFAVLIFKETVTTANLIGVILVIVGILLVNSGQETAGKEPLK